MVDFNPLACNLSRTRWFALNEAYEPVQSTFHSTWVSRAVDCQDGESAETQQR